VVPAASADDESREQHTHPSHARSSAGTWVNAETAARELSGLSVSNALAPVLLYQREGDERFERAARRWVRRVQVDHRLRHQEVEFLGAAVGAFDSRFSPIALRVIHLTVCVDRARQLLERRELERE
jgi:hypothetical protein